MHWHASTFILSEIVFITILCPAALGFDIFEDDHHQAVLPLPRPGYMTLVEDQVPSNGVLTYVRPGRRFLKLPQTLIPYPRTGRMTDEDYDLALIPDYAWSSSMESDQLETLPKISPRLGRKKRSISNGESGRHESENSQERHELEKAILGELEEFEPDFYFRQSRRPSSRSRNSFVPRVGKRLSDEDTDNTDDKRAVAFTPRIGRASLIPRIGRNDPRFKVKSRGAFIPRIGRRASLTPRIGRSSSHHEEEEN